MSNYNTAEEAKIRSIESMGEPLGKLYHALWQEVALLNFKWGEYIVLYGKDKSRIELLNEASPYFFHLMQRIFFEDVILHIARLTDSPLTCNKENLSIQSISSLIKDVDLKDKVKKNVTEALKLSKFCKDWRNRHIAHKDLMLAIKSNVSPLETANKKKIDDAMQSIVNILNIVGFHFSSSTTIFSLPLMHGAEALLQTLSDGIKFEELRKNRLENGEYNEEDYNRKYQ